MSSPSRRQQTGATALACTDRDGLYGTVKHLKACMAAGMDPVVGVDLAVFDDEGDLRTQLSGRVVVLAHGHTNGAGYKALCRLISDAHARTTGKAGGVVPVAVTRAELASRVLDPDTLKPVLSVLIGPDSDVGRALGGRRYLRPRTLFKSWLDAIAGWKPRRGGGLPSQCPGGAPQHRPCRPHAQARPGIPCPGGAHQRSPLLRRGRCRHGRCSRLRPHA